MISDSRVGGTHMHVALNHRCLMSLLEYSVVEERLRIITEQPGGSRGSAKSLEGIGGRKIPLCRRDLLRIAPGAG
jgi:hypothetical protein